MSDSNSRQFRPPLYNPQPERPSGRTDSDASREQEGWDAYRKWLKSMGGKTPNRRAPIDHSVYSWKGYQNWASRIRQSWEPEEN